MSDCLVSVIVPVYNCEAYLSKCIESLQNQTHKALEIILIDDGSVDTSPKICDIFASKDARIKAIHKKNSGAAAARKTGIAHITGEYVVFVDADDWVEQTYVEDLLMLAMEQRTEVVVGTFQCYAEGTYTKDRQVLHQGFYNKEQCEKYVFPNMLSAEPFYSFGVSPSMCGKLFKAEIARKNVDALDTGIIFGEDGCFTYSALLDCDSIYISRNNGYIYRKNIMSATHRFNEKLLLDGKKLRTFLQTLAVQKNWNVNTQIDEYMAYVCNYTVSRALKSSYARTGEGKKQMKAYIANVFPRGFFKNRKFRQSPIKTKIRYLLIRYRALSLLSKLVL